MPPPINEYDLGRDNEQQMSQLRRVLQLATRFTLILITVDGRRERVEILRRLSTWSGEDGVPQLDIVPLTALALEVTHPHGVVLVEPEAASRATLEDLIGQLNWRRDALPTHVHGPLVLVVGRVAHDLLFTRAPDLYSWRSHTVPIGRAPVALTPSIVRFTNEAERRQVEATLVALRDRGLLPASEQAHLELRLGELLLDDARIDPAHWDPLLDEADAHLTAALDASRRAGDSLLEMRALLGRAETTVHRGELERGQAELEAIARQSEPGSWSVAQRLIVIARIAEIAATIAHARHDPDVELAALQRAETNYQAAGDAVRRAHILEAEAAVFRLRGNDTGAERASAEAEALFRQTGAITDEVRVEAERAEDPPPLLTPTSQKH